MHRLTSVALLRGINVGPSSRIRMAELREVFEECGATDVRTHLQSGNVIFRGAIEVPALERAIRERFDYSSRVVVLTAAAFERIAAANPLLDVGHDPSKLVITFFVDGPPDVDYPADLGEERLVVGESALYQWFPDGILKSRLSPKFYKTLGPDATGRNLRTVDKILELLAEGQA
jgi:uncharacterized protein (DUF1697 family)